MEQGPQELRSSQLPQRCSQLVVLGGHVSSVPPQTGGQPVGLGSEEDAGDLQPLFLPRHLALVERTRSGASLLEVSPKFSPGGKFTACHLS